MSGDLCPACGSAWIAHDCACCDLRQRVRDAEKEARTLRLRYGVVSGWIVQALKVLDTLDPDDTHEADELRKLIAAGEMLALTTLANSKTPNG